MIMALAGFLLAVLAVALGPSPVACFCLGVTSMGLLVRIVDKLEER